MKNFSSLTAPGSVPLLLTTICVSILGFFTATAVNIAVPAIQADLQATLPQMQWILNSFIIMLSVFILVSGSLSDVLGRKRILLVGTGIFLLGSLASGAAPSVSWLIAARVLQGLGAALLIPQSLAIISSVYAENIRGTAIGFWSGASGAITVLGPVLAGVLVDTWGWRYIFYSLVPLAGISLFLINHYVPEFKTRQHGSFDWLGGLVLIAALLLLSIGLIQAQNQWGWPQTALIFVGLALTVMFYWVEKQQEQPLVSFAVIKQPTVLGANIFTLFMYTVISAISFFMPLYLQQVAERTAFETSLALLPLGLAITGVSFMSGRWADRYGNRTMLLLGAVGVGLGLGALLQLDVSYSYWGWVSAGLLLVGIGFGTFIPAVTKAALSVPESETGMASGFNNAISRFAGMVAVVVLGSSLSLKFGHQLEQRVDRPSILEQQEKVLEIEIPEQLDSSVRQELEQDIEQAFMQALRWQWWILLLATIGGVCSVLYWIKA